MSDEEPQRALAEAYRDYYRAVEHRNWLRSQYGSYLGLNARHRNRYRDAQDAVERAWARVQESTRKADPT